MAVRISITNAKGGVAKTSTAINVADALMYMGYRVLFIDLDPQMNSSSVYVKDMDEVQYDLLDLIKGKDIHSCITKTDFGEIIVGNEDLDDEEDKYYQRCRKNLYWLDEKLKDVDEEFHFIVFDTPPNVGTWMRSALFATNGVVVPFNAKAFAVSGLTRLLGKIDKIREESNPKLKVLGVCLTMYDKRNKQDKDIAWALPELGRTLGFHAFATAVATCQDIENAIANKQSLFRMKGNSNGAVDYVRLTHEILREVEEYGKE